MIVKIISDTHNDHQELDQNSLEADVLIHCGDFGTKGNYAEAYSFLHWFVKQPAKYKILVPGNHDGRIKKNAELQKLAYDFGIKLLMNDSIVINGFKFYGGHFVPFFNQGKYNTGRNKRREIWENIPKDTDVLITHAPPKLIFDTNVRGEHCGCDELLKAVQIVKPKYHVFGHIHEHAGSVKTLGSTTYMNCANKDESYLTTRLTPMEFEL